MDGRGRSVDCFVLWSYFIWGQSLNNNYFVTNYGYNLGICQSIRPSLEVRREEVWDSGYRIIYWQGLKGYLRDLGFDQQTVRHSGKRCRDAGFDCYLGISIRHNLSVDWCRLGKKMIFGIAMKEAGMWDSNEKEVGMQDQDSPFQTLYWVWPSLIKTHKSLDRLCHDIDIFNFVCVLLDLK